MRQCFRSGFTESGDPDPIRIQGFDDQKFKKIYSWQKNLILKIVVYLSQGLHKGRPSYKRSLQPSKENIQHLKTWNIFTFFYFWRSSLPSWIRIRIRNLYEEYSSSPSLGWVPTGCHIRFRIHDPTVQQTGALTTRLRFDPIRIRLTPP